jgi:DNA-binding PadR family transcriptional regulator
MIELLILAALHDGKNTIYKIKKNIDEKCEFFYQISFGSIYPMIKKLEENKYISAKKSFSKGGQKSSVYSITSTGKEYFIELMKTSLPENTALTNHLVNIKLLLLSYLSEIDQEETINILLKNLESKNISAKNFLQSAENILDSNLKFMNYNIQRQGEFIEWIKTNYKY